MTCEEFRAALSSGPVGEGRSENEERRRHAAACPSCAASHRAALLLRLGSARDDEAAPAPGFEERLRARLRMEQAPRRAPAWNGGFDLLVRPALAAAALMALVCAGLYVTAPDDPADLASLVDPDAMTSLMAGSPEALFDGTTGTASEAARP